MSRISDVCAVRSSNSRVHVQSNPPLVTQNVATSPWRAGGRLWACPIAPHVSLAVPGGAWVVGEWTAALAPPAERFPAGFDRESVQIATRSAQEPCPDQGSTASAHIPDIVKSKGNSRFSAYFRGFSNHLESDFPRADGLFLVLFVASKGCL